MLKKFKRPFQVHIVAAMCRLPQVMGRLHSLVDPDIFDDEALSSIIGFSVKHFTESSGELVAFTSMYEAMPDDVQTVVDEVWEEEISDPNFVIENVVDFVRQQSVERAVTEAAEKIDQGDHEGIVELVQDALHVGDDFGDLGEFFHADFDDRSREYTHPESITRLPTGLADLDRCMNGGLEPGELGVILAPPKAGKSFTLVNIGYGAARFRGGSVNVVHYSCEMKQRKIQRRYDTRVAGVKLAHVLQKNPREFIKQLRRRKRKIVGGEVLVKGYRTRGASVSTLRAHLSSVRSFGFDFGLVIVDYADILRPVRRLGELRHEQAGIYEDLRGLADEFGVPIWTASQANRNSLNKRVVTMADVAESFEKIAVADAVVALCRTHAEIAKNRGRLFLAALREQPMGKIIECTFDLKHSMIRTIRVNTQTDTAGQSRTEEKDAQRAQAALDKV